MILMVLMSLEDKVLDVIWWSLDVDQPWIWTGWAWAWVRDSYSFRRFYIHSKPHPKLQHPQEHPRSYILSLYGLSKVYIPYKRWQLFCVVAVGRARAGTTCNTYIARQVFIWATTDQYLISKSWLTGIAEDELLAHLTCSPLPRHYTVQL